MSKNKNKGGKKGNNKPAAKTQQPAQKAAEKKTEEKKTEEKAPEVPPTPDNTNDGVQQEAPTLENGGVTVEKPGDGSNVNRPGDTQKNKISIIDDDTAKMFTCAIAHGMTGSLDANHRVELYGLMRKTFVDEQRPEFVVPLETQVHMNRIVQLGIISEIATATVSGDSAFSIVMQKSGYPELVAVAKEVGVTLPSIKTLEDLTSDSNKAKGAIAIPAGKGSGVKVSAEAKKQLQKDKEVQENPPELDPKKISSDEDLTKALNYLLSKKGRNFGQKIVDTVDFMRNYRMNLASQADNSTKAMEELDKRTTATWLEDIFEHADPSFVATGLGRGMNLTLDKTGSPVRAFTLLHDSIKDGDKVAWDDQSIADATVAIIRWITQTDLKHEKENLAALGDPKKYDDSAKEIAPKYEEGIKKMQNRLDILVNPPSDFVTNFLDRFHNMDKDTVTLYSIFRRIYYPETLTDENKNKVYKNLEENIAQRVGIVFNMFKSTAKVDGYSEDNLTDLVAYTDEELKAQKKAEAEAKKAEKEAEAAKKLLPRCLLIGAYMASGRRSRRK